MNIGAPIKGKRKLFWRRDGKDIKHLKKKKPVHDEYPMLLTRAPQKKCPR